MVGGRTDTQADAGHLGMYMKEILQELVSNSQTLAHYGKPALQYMFRQPLLTF